MTGTPPEIHPHSTLRAWLGVSAITASLFVFLTTESRWSSGVSFGVVQLCRVNMTQAAAPDTFEAAMSLNTMAYNTSIALGALFGGLLADRLGVTSVVWFGAALTAASLLLTLGDLVR